MISRKKWRWTTTNIQKNYEGLILFELIEWKWRFDVSCQFSKINPPIKFRDVQLLIFSSKTEHDSIDVKALFFLFLFNHNEKIRPKSVAYTFFVQYICAGVARDATGCNNLFAVMTENFWQFFSESTVLNQEIMEHIWQLKSEKETCFSPNTVSQKWILIILITILYFFYVWDHSVQIRKNLQF